MMAESTTCQEEEVVPPEIPIVEPTEKIDPEIPNAESDNSEQIIVSQVSAFARSAAEEVKAAFGGKWRLDRNDKYDDFLREIGINFIMRKVAVKSKPIQLIVVDPEDASIKISTSAGVWSNEEIYKIGEEYEKEVNKVKVKGTVKWEDGHLIMEQKPDKPTASSKAQIVHRERVADELVMTIYTGNVVCKRYFKRLDD